MMTRESYPRDLPCEFKTAFDDCHAPRNRYEIARHPELRPIWPKILDLAHEYFVENRRNILLGLWSNIRDEDGTKNDCIYIATNPTWKQLFALNIVFRIAGSGGPVINNAPRAEMTKDLESIHDLALQLKEKLDGLKESETATYHRITRDPKPGHGRSYVPTLDEQIKRSEAEISQEATNTLHGLMQKEIYRKEDPNHSGHRIDKDAILHHLPELLQLLAERTGGNEPYRKVHAPLPRPRAKGAKHVHAAKGFIELFKKFTGPRRVDWKYITPLVNVSVDAEPITDATLRVAYSRFKAAL